MGNYVRASLYALGLGVTCISVAACSSDDGTSPAPDSGASDATPDVVLDTAAPDADSGPALVDNTWTTAEWTKIQTLSPLPAVPKDTTNKYADDANAAKLGQMLFYDRSYSGALTVGNDGTNGGLGAIGETGKVSCASCHGITAPTMDDDRSTPPNVSLGTNFGTRNALSIVNSSFYAWTNWGGRFDSQWSLPLTVAENGNIMKSSRLQIAHMIWDKYKTEYEAVFGALDPDLDPNAGGAARFPASGKPKAQTSDPDGAWEGMAVNDQKIVNRIYANYGKALQAYMRLVVSRNTDLDKYVAGTYGALSTNEKEGLRVFIGKGKCVTCHSGPNMADDQFYALGVPQTGPHVPATDNGRFQDVPGLLTSIFNVNGDYSDDKTTTKLTGLAQDPGQKGRFRTKSLRGVSRSGPYMHSGQFATLEEVVDFYDVGGGDVGDAGAVKDPKITPLGLTAAEKQNLVAFMKKLEGEAVAPALLKDTSK